jgi:hypothetical protein
MRHRKWTPGCDEDDEDDDDASGYVLVRYSVYLMGGWVDIADCGIRAYSWCEESLESNSVGSQLRG